MALLRHADVATDQPRRIDLQVQRRAGRGDAQWKQQVAPVGESGQVTFGDPFRRRPLDGTGRRTGSRFNSNLRRHPRITRIPPVSVPTRRHLQMQRHCKRHALLYRVSICYNRRSRAACLDLVCFKCLRPCGDAKQRDPCAAKERRNAGHAIPRTPLARDCRSWTGPRAAFRGWCGTRPACCWLPYRRRACARRAWSCTDAQPQSPPPLL